MIKMSFIEFLKENYNYPSKYKIGERVTVILDNKKFDAYIRIILFSNMKIRYSVRTVLDNTTLHNIDSSFVYDSNIKEIINMSDDNYS
jgi:hypothetical protein